MKNVVLLVMVYVLLILWQLTSPPRNLIFVDKCTMGCLGHIRVIAYNTLWHNHGLGNIHLIILVVINLVLQMKMANLVWVLGPPTFPPIKMIIGLMVAILCHIILVIIHTWVIQMKTGTIIHHIGVWSINLELLVMVEVVLVIGPHNSTPIKLILPETFMMKILVHLRVITQHSLWCNIWVRIIQLNLTMVIN